MTVVKVNRHSQIIIPADMRKKFHIVEGDYLEIEERGEELVIKPLRTAGQGHAYFQTTGWQACEAEADNDIAQGNILGPFGNIDDLIKALED